jgi:hypothetical protein
MSDRIGPMCARGRHQMCGGANCWCSCHPGTPEERANAAQEHITAFLQELEEVMTSTGYHDGHQLTQVGRCVYCDCGYRYQGSLVPRR